SVHDRARPDAGVLNAMRASGGLGQAATLVRHGAELRLDETNAAAHYALPAFSQSGIGWAAGEAVASECLFIGLDGIETFRGFGEGADGEVLSQLDGFHGWSSLPGEGDVLGRQRDSESGKENV